MQEKHYDGLVSPVEAIKSIAKLEGILSDEDVEKIEVFKKDSPAHANVQKAWGDMTPNQKRKMRRRLKKRG